jgi:hypothetical protein
LPDLTKAGNSFRHKVTLPAKQESCFYLYPNPSDQYTIIKYDLGNKKSDITKYYFSITNNSGKKVDQIAIKSVQDQIILITDNYTPGAYVCSLVGNGQTIQSATFIVAK